MSQFSDGWYEVGPSFSHAGKVNLCLGNATDGSKGKNLDMIMTATEAEDMGMALIKAAAESRAKAAIAPKRAAR